MRFVRGAMVAAALFLALVTGMPQALAAVDCTTGVPAGWEVIPEASSGGDLSFLCNYRVTKKLPDGSTTTSGTAITVEFFCSPAQGREAFKGKTNPRDTETARGEDRVVIEEGPAARNPDNPHRDGVTTSFFPDRTFNLFEKEWLLFGGQQAVATIVVITDDREGRHSVADVEAAPLRNLTFRNAPEQCTIPLGGGGGAASPGASGGGKKGSGTVATGGGGVPPAVVVAAAGGGTAVIVTVVTNGRRRKKMLKPPKKYAGGNPWDPDDTERAKKWDKEGLVWDPKDLTWRPPRPDDFIDIDDTPVNTNEIPAPCRELLTTLQRQQKDVENIKTYHAGQEARLQKGRKIYKENLARAVIIIGADVVGATIAVAEGVANIPRAVIRTRSLVKNLNKADAGLEFSHLQGKRKTLSADLDASKKRVAELEAEANTAAANATKARGTRTAAENHATQMEKSARKAIVDETPPPELVSRRQRNIDSRKQFEAELKKLDALDEDTAQRAWNFTKRESDLWEKSPDAKNLADDLRGAREEVSQFRAANKELGDLQSAVREQLGKGRISQADADEIMAMIPKEPFQAYNKTLEKLEGNVRHFEDRGAKIRQNFKARQEGYDEAFEPYFKTSAVSPEESRQYLRNKLAQLDQSKAQIDADFETFRQNTVVKNQKLLDDAAAARRKALDAGTDAEHPEHLERSANESLRNARADLAKKQAALKDSDSRMGELQKKLAKLDDKPPPIAPVRLVGWLMTPVGWVMEKVIGPTDSPEDIVKILGGNKIQLQRMEDTVKIGEKLITEKGAEAAATLEKLKQCIAVNRPQQPIGR